MESPLGPDGTVRSAEAAEPSSEPTDGLQSDRSRALGALVTRLVGLLAARLGAWAAAAITFGCVALLLSDNPWVAGIAMQATAWGVVDGAIAAVSALARPRSAPEVRIKRLTRILYVNVGLDVVYVCVGTVIAAAFEPTVAGHGLGIAIQGAFLFFFDLFHGRLAKALAEVASPAKEDV